MFIDMHLKLLFKKFLFFEKLLIKNNEFIFQLFGIRLCL